MIDTQHPIERERAPSELAAEEPALARMAGGVGIGLALVGALALWMNTSKPRLIGPTLAVTMTVLGLASLLYHAARDADQLVRRSYILAALAALGIGAALTVTPLPLLGDGFVPGGLAGLLLGLFFLLAAARHEVESPWTGIVATAASALGLALTIGGFVGVGLSPEFLPRFAGMSVVGLIFWWAAVGRWGRDSFAGLSLGRLLILVGIVTFGVAVVASCMPGRFFVPRGASLGLLGLAAACLGIGVSSDRPVVAMARRELAAYFYSPIAYIVLFGSVVVGWVAYLFFVGALLESHRQQPLYEPIVQSYSVDFFSIIMVIFVVPAVTMRLLSEERRTGTVEVLLTSPVSEWQVVLSKFIAGLLYFLTLFVPWALFLIPVYYAGRDGFDYLPLLGFFVTLVITGSAFVATGLFCSSLTKNQIIAAVLCFAAMMLYLALPFALRATGMGGSLRQTLQQLSFIQIWSASVSGSLPTHPLLVYISATVFWLYLTTKVLEARKWS